MSHHLAVVGSLNADQVIEVPRLPLPGDTVVGRGRRTVLFGGKGANQAAAAASFRAATASVSMVGCVGDDEVGRDMTDALDSLGVDITGVCTEAGPSGRAIIAVEPQGQNLILVEVGANGLLTPRHVETPQVATAAAVLVQVEIPVETAAAALRHSSGIRILNPAPAVDASPLLSHADVVVPNRSELALLCDAPVASTLDHVVEQVRSLALSAVVVVTLGADGALLVEPGAEPILMPALPSTVVDTTGAGDCFCGVLAVELARNRSVRDACQAAVITASLSVTEPGARGRLPVPGDLATDRSADQEASC